MFVCTLKKDNNSLKATLHRTEGKQFVTYVLLPNVYSEELGWMLGKWVRKVKTQDLKRK